jgi:Permuted papain-like amidase enzyme, YaeF/YiiX, C92 family
LRIHLPLILAIGIAGCTGMRPVVRQYGPAADSQTRTWRDEIVRLGRDGDWLVIRGYNSADHLVAVAANAELSHVGILDAAREEVIEAVAPVVRDVPLQSFLEGADRAVLIRPTDADRKSGGRALKKARSQIGAPYDFLGTIGFPEESRFYCSELAVWSIGREVDRVGPEEVLLPAALPKFGTVLFDSSSRGDEVAVGNPRR